VGEDVGVRAPHKARNLVLWRPMGGDLGSWRLLRAGLGF
jgi:hypothetical protein